MSMLNYNYFSVEFNKDPSCLNRLYEEIILQNPNSFLTFDEYSRVIYFLVQKYVIYNDYLHSNNLLQQYRINCNEKNMDVNKCSWFLYYSLKIYSKRSIKYYLENPSIFWENIYCLASLKDSELYDRLNNLLVDTLEFYKKEYANQSKYLKDAMQKFVNYYFANKEYSPLVTAHLNELKTLISSPNNDNEVLETYHQLPSQNIPEPEVTASNEDKQEAIKTEEKFFGDTKLSSEDRKKMIMIIGDNPFVHETNIIYGIAKEYNIYKDQLEFFTDYEKIKSEGETIVRKTQYNDKYIGIIFGSNPHSTTGNEGSSSLISKINTEPGFPFVVECRTSSNGQGRLKITKTSFKNALRDVIINYKSK